MQNPYFFTYLIAYQLNAYKLNISIHLNGKSIRLCLPKLKGGGELMVTRQRDSSFFTRHVLFNRLRGNDENSKCI